MDSGVMWVARRVTWFQANVGRRYSPMFRLKTTNNRFGLLMASSAFVHILAVIFYNFVKQVVVSIANSKASHEGRTKGAADEPHRS